MKLSVILLSYNTAELLLSCLASLASYPSRHRSEIIVVDNGSTDGSPERVRESYPSVKVIETGENLGFAGGNNVGIRAAAGEYRLLLNSDTEVREGSLDALVACLETHPKAGACGAQLVYPDGRPQPSGSSFITLRNLLWEQFFFDKAFPRSPVFAEHFLTDWHYRERRKLDVLSGACLLLRTDCLEQIGLLDSNFFMYCEDVDWCLRAARAGWDRIFEPAARVIHHHGASSRSHRPEMVTVYNRSRFYYFRKHFGLEAAGGARRIMTGGAKLRSLAWKALEKAGKPGAGDQAEDWRRIAELTAALDLESLPAQMNDADFF